MFSARKTASSHAGGALSVLFSRIVRISEQSILVPRFLSSWGVATCGEWLTLTAVVAFVSFTTLGWVLARNYALNSFCFHQPEATCALNDARNLIGAL
jgi:hypothetical protein